MKRIGVVFLLVLVAATGYAKRPKRSNPAFGILVKGIQSGEALVRAIAVSGLWRFKKEGKKYMEEALGDPQWIVRREAIRGLFLMGNTSRALQQLRKELSDPTLPWERDFAVIADAMKLSKAKRFVRELLDSPKCSCKDAILKSLLMYGGRWTTFVVALAGKGNEAAIKALKEAPRDVVVPLLPKLYSTRNPKAIEFVLEVTKRFDLQLPIRALRSMARTKDPALRGRLAVMLAERGDKSALRFVKGFFKGDEEQLKVFLKVASLVGDRRIANQIKKRFLNRDTPTEILTLTLMALARVGDQDAAVFVAKGVNSTDENVRVASVRTLHLFQKGGAIPLLKKLVFDGNPNVRVAAVQALGELGRKEAIDVLERALNKSFDTRFKVKVVEALGKIHDNAVVGVLSYHVYDPIEVKKAVIRVISTIHTKEAAKILKPFLDNPDPEIRKWALLNVMEVDPKKALEAFDSTVNGLTADELVGLAIRFKDRFRPFLEKAFDSLIPYVRSIALRCLFVLDKKNRRALMEKLIALSEYPDVRLGILQAAAKEDCHFACPLARKLLEDKDMNCKLAAVRVIGTCCGKEAKQTLITLMTGEMGPVAVQAAATYLTVPRRPPKRLSPLEINQWILR